MSGVEAFENDMIPAGAVTGTLRGDAPEFVPSSNPLLPPMQAAGLSTIF